MFISTSPTPLPVIQATPEPRVTAPHPVKAPSFSSLLRQNRAAPPPANPPAVPAPPAMADTSAQDAEPAASDDGTPAASANTAQRSRTSSADKAPRPPTKTPAKAETHDAEAEAEVADAGTRSTDGTAATAEHPLLAQWLSHLHRPVEVPAETLARGTAAKGDAATANLTADTAAGAKGNPQDTAALALPTGAGHDPASAGQASLAAATDNFAQRFDAAAAVASASAAASASHKHDGLPAPIDASSATPAAAASFAAGVASASLRPAEPTAVAIATPVNAPDFPQALGMQLSVLAKDGIQHAELHLNPADMGPVSVQIEMKGSQAHIDFGADVAATRHAIEAGLPELASALRDAGFTLSGGGVSQHSRGGSEPGGHGDSRRNGPGTAAIGAATDGATAATNAAMNASRRAASIGGLDLYA